MIDIFHIDMFVCGIINAEFPIRWFVLREVNPELSRIASIDDRLIRNYHGIIRIVRLWRDLYNHFNSIRMNYYYGSELLLVTFASELIWFNQYTFKNIYISLDLWMPRPPTNLLKHKSCPIIYIRWSISTRYGNRMI